MRIIIITICLLFLSGCTQYIEPIKIGVVDFEVGGEIVTVGGERLMGGTEIQDFKPEVKLEKWGDETYIKVWTEETGDNFATKINDKVIWHNTDKSKEYNFYPIENGFEYEIILKEKPKTNVITLKIESKGLKFYYQPPLDEEHYKQDCWTESCTATNCCGNERPENIVGSYAVYHESKAGDYTAMGGKNYMAGKAFHIYRPQMVDSNGWKVWGELNIDIKKGIQTITIPQDFLDKAVYPIYHASGETFGVSSEGQSASSSYDGRASTGGDYIHTASSGDTIIKFSVYMRNTGSNSYAYEAAYSLSGAEEPPETRLGSATTITVNSAANPQWWHSSAVSIEMVDSVTYCVAVAQGLNQDLDRYYDSGSGKQYYSMTTATLPETWSWNNYGTAFYSWYATYSTGGGPSGGEYPAGNIRGRISSRKHNQSH